jgi:hypothetical protein
MERHEIFSSKRNSFKEGCKQGMEYVGRILFHLNFKDTQGGAKFLKRKVLRDIGTNFYCKGFETDVELLWRIKRRKFNILEICVPSSFRKESKFTMLNAISMFLNILKLRVIEFYG